MASDTPQPSDPSPQPVSQIRSMFEGMAAKNSNPSNLVPPLTPSRLRKESPPKSPPPSPKPIQSRNAASSHSKDLAQALKRAPPLPPSALVVQGRSSPPNTSSPQTLAPSPLPPDVPARPPSTALSNPLVSHSDIALLTEPVTTGTQKPFSTPLKRSTPSPQPRNDESSGDSTVMAHPPLPPRIRHNSGSNPPDEVSSASSTPSALQRKAPPPPPASKRPYPSSRSPSPQPPSAPAPKLPPPELPARPLQASETSRTSQPRPHPSREGTSSTVTATEADGLSLAASSSTSGSSLVSKISSTTSSSTGIGDTLLAKRLLNDQESGPRRGSMPDDVLHHEQLQVEEPSNMERSATDPIEHDKGSAKPPPPPPRLGLGGRPVLPPGVPPRPPSRRVTPTTQHLIVPNSSTPPPLPSRDRNSLIISDDDASSSSAATTTGNHAGGGVLAPPPPPPRRTVTIDALSHSPVSTTAPPPLHPGLGRPSHSHRPSAGSSGALYNAVNKVRTVLPLAHSASLRNPSVERPRSASGGAGRSATMFMTENDATATAEIVNDSMTPLLPPPVRSKTISHKPTTTRGTSSLPQEDDGGSSSGEENETPTSSLKGPSAEGNLPPRRTIEDLPDSSRSSRRPPFASLSNKDGGPIGLNAPHKAVYALGGGMFCVGRHEVTVYDLSSFDDRMPSDIRQHRHQHRRLRRHPLPSGSSSSSTTSSSSSDQSPPGNKPRPKYVVELKDIKGLMCRVDSPVVTAMEFAPRRVLCEGAVAEDVEVGRFLWCGTKDGHLWELDVVTGQVTAIKNAAHRAAVIHILRYKTSMVTIDESGKTLVFSSPDTPPPRTDGTLQGEDGWTDLGSLMHTTPQITRIADKQGFARILYGKLWTSAGSSYIASETGLNSTAASTSATTASTSRGSVIRLYDIFAPMTSDTGLTRSGVEIPPMQGKSAVLLSTELGVGAVTSGAVLINKPQLVYLGHEGGYISVWDVSHIGQSPASALGPSSPASAHPSPITPSCIQTVKVSVTDIMCLQGVHTRLWAGSRNGLISAYDVEHHPWLVTNAWKHGGYGGARSEGSEEGKRGLPVMKLMVDIGGAVTTGRLTAVSIGRDECARFWDGFLSYDWIDNELIKREASFSSFRSVKVLVCTWNVDAAKPDTLNSMTGTGDGSGTDNLGFLNNVLSSVDKPDIIVFGFQEVIDLENRKLTAKTVLLGSANAHKVSRAYRLWYDRLVYAVRVAMPPDAPYSVIHTENLVGLFSCIFVRNSERESLRDVAITTVKRGMGGHYGNKGAIVSRFVIDDSSFCFINCHLAAGQGHKNARNQDLAAVLEEKSVFPEAADEAIVYAGGGDGSMVLDHEFVFLNGDLNYRIDQRREAVMAHIRNNDIQYLLTHDQLLKEMKHNR
ncbi:hypothetical protein FRB99_002676, partial [Tulasnella sp. 403]